MRIGIIGKGNVGSHLFTAFTRNGQAVEIIDSRTLEGIDNGFDLILISVTDTAIKSVAEKLSQKLHDFEGVVAHTAGSVEMNILEPYFKNIGVFYPLQTFSKGVTIRNYSEIPIFIEGNSNNTEQLLTLAAKKISAKIYCYDSKKRKKLHIASVFACNFTNALYGLSEEYLAAQGIPFEVLRPLISQTAEKVMNGYPTESQTGPARRNDREIIEDQYKTLANESLLHARIYEIMTEYIRKKYN